MVGRLHEHYPHRSSLYLKVCTVTFDFVLLAWKPTPLGASMEAVFANLHAFNVRLLCFKPHALLERVKRP